MALFFEGEEAAGDSFPEAFEDVGFATFFGTGLLAIQPASNETTSADASLQKFVTNHRFSMMVRLNIQIEETLLLAGFPICKQATVSAGAWMLVADEI